ncbi:MAG: hypothetical protein M1483_08840 [Actinobacteria bacterium]|nr:hypothetical protein [Actinomycetota bacterium]MCL6105709.1 hypothetical protein [Actinomycetota bacterium]
MELVNLTCVGSSFEAKVVAARLGAEGIIVELRGAIGSIYPVGGPVEIYVEADKKEMATQILGLA